MKLMILLALFSTFCFAKKIDFCLENVSDQRHKLAGLKYCKDQSTSFKQPNGIGINGYEGRCGQTAAANVTYFYCQMVLHPVVDINAYFSDPGPGVAPRTLRDGLNDLFKSASRTCPQGGAWKRVSYKNSSEYLKGIESGLKAKVEFKHKLKRYRSDGKMVFTTPIPVLIAQGSYLHWVTVIDLVKTNNDCKVIYVDQGTQTEVSCDSMVKSSYEVGKMWYPLLNSYTLIKYE
jgi:hypothetical protein